MMKYEKIMTMTGEEVMTKEAFIGFVKFNPMKKKLIFSAAPVNPQKANIGKSFRSIFSLIQKK